MVPTNELEGYARSSRTKHIVYAVVVLGALASILYLTLKPVPREPVPEFELPLLRGGSLSSHQLKGTPIVLNFFASWCEPCREEAPLLERTWRRYRSRGVRIVGVNVRDTERDARRFVRDYGLSYPVVVDRGEELSSALGIHGLPQTFFVTADWELLGESAGEEVGTEYDTTKLGAVSRAELEANIERLLESAEEAQRQQKSSVRHSSRPSFRAIAAITRPAAGSAHHHPSRELATRPASSTAER